MFQKPINLKRNDDFGSGQMASISDDSSTVQSNTQNIQSIAAQSDFFPTSDQENLPTANDAFFKRGELEFANKRPLTEGEKAVGLGLNQKSSPEVYFCQKGFAELIDQMEELRSKSTSDKQKRHASIAITEMETAKFRAVQALTWKD